MFWQKTIDFIKNSFKESSGISSMRINSTVMTVNICMCIIYITVTGKDPGQHWELYVGLFGVAMGMKVWQKFAENKSTTNADETTAKVETKVVQKKEEETKNVQDSSGPDGINRTRD